MRKPANRYLLSMLLTLLLLVQSAVGVAGWHLDLPHDEHDSSTPHCSAMVLHHHDAHHVGGGEAQDEHHHYCQMTVGSIALFTTSPLLSFIGNSETLSAYRPDLYLDPLVELPIRPPIS